MSINLTAYTDILPVNGKEAVRYINHGIFISLSRGEPNPISGLTIVIKTKFGYM